jgi:hypothetical protein
VTGGDLGKDGSRTSSTACSTGECKRGSIARRRGQLTVGERADEHRASISFSRAREIAEGSTDLL